MEIVNPENLGASISTLLSEAYRGPAGHGSWFTDEEPDCGVLGTLAGLTAEEASRPLTPAGAGNVPGDGATAASHASHLAYALSLANRAMRGENPYKNADWSGSWAVTVVGDAAWKALRARLEKEFSDLMTAISDPGVWSSPQRMTGMMGNIAHSAWHLGALRQALGLVRTPSPAAAGPAPSAPGPGREAD